MTTGADNGSGMIRPTDPRIGNAPIVWHRCEVVAPTREGVIDQLVEVLSAEGYFVSKKVAWEKVGAFLRRLDLDHRKFHQLLKHPSCPPVELMRGSGRKQILALNPNPVFEAFCLAVKGTKPKRAPGVRTWKPKMTIAEGRRSRKKPAHLLKRKRQRRYQTETTP